MELELRPINYRRILVWLGVFALGITATSARAQFGLNLLVNGDAEAAAGSPDGDVVPVPGWATTAGNFTGVQYAGGAGFPTLTDPGPADRGLNFFAGGGGPFSSATQLIDVSAGVAEINIGNVAFSLSGYLGGFSTQGDFASLTVQFQDAGGVALGSAMIGPVTNTERGNQTGLLLRETSGLVPVGTTQIEALLKMTRQNGSYNDGYADNLALTLSAPPPPQKPVAIPEPGTLALLAAGLLTLVGCARQRRRKT